MFATRISELSHPNIVKFLGVHYKSGSDVPILIMECLPMSLTNYMEQNKVISNDIKKSILLDVSLGLLYLHTQTPPLLHCDLNAENILLTPNMKAKISDFGVSRTFEPDPGKYYMKVSKIPGNRLYMPPEVLKDGYRLTGDKLDVFSFGLLILHVCTQKFPKPIDSRDECTEVQKRQHLLDEVKDVVLKQLAMDCLNNDPQDRPCTIALVRRIEGIIYCNL